MTSLRRRQKTTDGNLNYREKTKKLTKDYEIINYLLKK